MRVKPPVRPPDSTDKVVKELLRQLPHADPDLKGEPTRPQTPSRPRPSSPQIMKPPPPGWQRSWGWVALAVVLGVGLTQWPYPRGCGLPLYGYLCVVALLPALAIKAVVVSWTDRRAVAHGLAFVALLGAAVLAAEAVLPRVGYARNAAAWSCGVIATKPVIPNQPTSGFDSVPAVPAEY